MNTLEILRAVILNIRENKVKVLMTTLGIIVGAMTIVVVLAIGKGGQAAIEEQYKSLNVGTIMVMQAPGPPGTQRKKLSEENLKALLEGAKDIKVGSIVLSGTASVSYGSVNSSFSVQGVTETIATINNMTLAAGRFIEAADNEDKSRVAVIGMGVVDELFDGNTEEVVGQKLSINGKRFDIIGVLTRTSDSGPGMSQDDSVYIPYSVAQHQITGRRAEPRIMLLCGDVNRVQNAMDDISAVLKEQFGEGSSSIAVRNAGSRVESARKSAATMTMLLFSVAIVVVIVGGIGIMNVLYVTVRERTREIGILKAIGARRRDILQIFLMEAVFISCAGGILGIGLGEAAIPIMKALGVDVVTSLSGDALAFTSSVVIGTFFGYYPASKASVMKPIDALNFE